MSHPNHVSFIDSSAYTPDVWSYQFISTASSGLFDLAWLNLEGNTIGGVTAQPIASGFAVSTWSLAVTGVVRGQTQGAMFTPTVACYINTGMTFAAPGSSVVAVPIRQARWFVPANVSKCLGRVSLQ